MKLIHMQTTIQTVFGVVDDDGNAIPQQPITAQVSRFNADAFAEGYEAIAEARDQALANAEETAPNRAQRRAKVKPYGDGVVPSMAGPV